LEYVIEVSCDGKKSYIKNYWFFNIIRHNIKKIEIFKSLKIP
jgi:hypothetical protein